MTKTLDFVHFIKGKYNIQGFTTGIDELDNYIKHRMSQNEVKNLSRHYFGIYKKELISIMCLSTSIIKTKNEVSSEKGFPDEMELPTIKIGRLVVDKRYRNNRFGEQTLKKAISLFVSLSKLIGVIGLTVDSKNESVDFYKKYGFKELKTLRKTPYSPLILYTAIIKQENPNLFESV